MTRSDRDERGIWPPPRGVFVFRRWHADDQTRPTAVLVRHPAAPFVWDVDRDDERRLERQLQEAAHGYLADVDREVRPGLPDWWLAALDPVAEAAHPDFGWLPLVRPEGDGPRPIGSSIARSDPERGKPSLTFVLLASERVGDFVLGSEFGVRVVAHARPVGNGRLRLRIAGFSASLPFGEYRSSGRPEEFWTGFGERGFVRTLLERSVAPVAGKLGLDPASVYFRGIRLGRSGGESRRIELRGRGISAPRTPRSEPYEFTASMRVGMDRQVPNTLSSTKVPLSACMAGTARVFRCDPASQGGPRDYRKRRPTRSEEELDKFREEEVEPVPLELEGLLTVVQTWFVSGDDPPSNLPKSVPLPNPDPPPPFPSVRSNDFSAVSAYRNLSDVFQRFRLYGIDPAEYFNRASLPIKAFYRSGVRPGPGKDGETVNACVLPEGWDVNEVARPAGGDRPVLQVHLALGDLSTRARKPRAGGKASRAEPLGIAADPNWLWHEMAHVLMMATLGELEFRFAHSCGDALAAIVADPCSRLGARPEDSRWRYHTFPWVYLPRRHDRCVLHGWGWRGSLGRAVRRLPDRDRLRRKGYWTEQILSTTLFRLYRCLGGETVLPGTTDPDPVARKRASDYTVYLIIKALQILGEQRGVAATHVELFAAALAAADEGTETCPTDDGHGDIVPRVGGCARKAVDWAFVAQGMGPGDPREIHEEPGPPSPVDVYIKDRRPGDEELPSGTVPHGPGTYVPVSLDWGGPTPQWFAADADGDGIRRVDGGIAVKVANRGTAAAEGVTVTLRWHAQPENRPPWDAYDAGWVSSADLPPQNIAPGAGAVFGPFAPPALPAGQYLVLAEADCAEDRSNIHPATGLACTRHPTPLNELVPFDNNLGLAEFKLPLV